MKFGDFTYADSFREGDRIKWEYIHSLNSRSKVKRVKTGVFVRYIKQKEWVGHSRSAYALVRFDGNKTDSKVFSAELMHEVMTREIYRRNS